MEGKIAKTTALPEVDFHDLAAGLTALGLDHSRPAIVHASLSSFGHVRGGAETVVSALLTSFSGVMMPAFTYQTMITPSTGPPKNGLLYGTGGDRNRMAAYWSPDMPADRLMGAVSETLRHHRKASRSDHPVLSFTGVGVGHLLSRQRLHDPLAPIAALVEEDGAVVLLGVGHSVNTGLHYAEQRAGRKTFTRWALTKDGVQTCPNFPGCSNGFVELEPILATVARSLRVGAARILAMRARDMVEIAETAFRDSPRGYLCKRMDCGRCDAMRRMT